MSAINVTSVEVLDNPTNFANPLQFEIQYECLYQLEHGAPLAPPSFTGVLPHLSAHPHPPQSEALPCGKSLGI